MAKDIIIITTASGWSTPTPSLTSIECNQVSWDSPDDPANPKNWTKGRKWATSLIISSFAFLSPLCSSITAPALSSIGHDLHIPVGVELQLVLSIFLLAYAIGPFVLSPCSEVWGRVPVIRFGNMIFILFTALCGAATSQSQITAFRFLAGLGGSASVGMGSGVLTDCWRPEERGRGIAVYQLTQVLGPAVGPIAGGYISQYASWRWCFFIIVLANITVQAIAFFFLQETYAPRLLQDKARRLREKTGNPMLRTEWEQSDENRTFLDLLLKALCRPWVMLGTQPIVQVLAVYQAFNFGVLYLLISGFPALWEDRYGMPRGDASLNYLSLAIGSLVGVTVCGPATDAVYAALKRRRGISDDQPGVPEFRMPLVIPVSIISPAAIFLYGWAAQEKLHWIVPNIGAAIFSGSSIVCYQCISAYLADTYNLHSASASSACAFLRSILAFAFPLFVPALFGNLGYGVGGSVIGVVAIVVGVPAPWIIWFYGPRMRGASQFAGAGLSSARKATSAIEKV
ncbi:major facilitator superfamily transporter [Immersiella caudata]|uniref:Major facilitator superfamily transporter n=1 Tax=Immersiella caudata TaxID=314043 RepID=A0AA39WKD9_9PEZI|nr:major facilitator superfamily transporter [Immersiella caudata]